MNRVRSFQSAQRKSFNGAIAASWLLTALCVSVAGGCSDQGVATPAPSNSATGGSSSGSQGGGTSAGNQGGSSNASVGGASTGGSVNNATGGSDNNPATGGAANDETGGAGNDETGGAGNDETGGAGNDETGGAGNDETGGAGNDGTGGAGSTECLNSGSGNGYCTDTGCVTECQYGDKTDADSSGTTDGYGWELQANCVVAGGAVASASSTRCEPEARTDLPTPGDGRQYKDDTGTMGDCMPQCQYGTDTVDTSNGSNDGFGWELQDDCVVADSVAAAKGIPCVPVERTDLPTPGDGYQFMKDGAADGPCRPPCTHGTLTDTDSGVDDGWGWELQTNCIVPDSVAAKQGIPCVPPERTDLPTPGDGYQFLASDGTPDGGCRPPCPSSVTDADASGWGWDNTAQVSCIVPDSIAAAQGMPCVP